MAKPFEHLSPREFQRLTTLKKTRYLAALSRHLSVTRSSSVDGLHPAPLMTGRDDALKAGSVGSQPTK